MKYILLIYQVKDYDPKQLSADDHKAVAEAYAAINAMPNVKPGSPLGLLSDAITVRSVNGKAVPAKGPYIEPTGGSVGGYYEIEADSDEEAVALASKIPAIRQGGAVEIRPSRAYW